MKRSLWLAVLASLVLAAPASANCDNLDPAVCLQPFPNNFFTKPSATTDTGLKVNFALTDMPRNAAGKPIQPGQWNRSDGFGDHQVSNWVAAVEARTIGARLRGPALDTFRDPSSGYQYFGEIPAIPSYPYSGSAITVWDSGAIRDNCTHGTAASLFANLPVFGGCPAGQPQDEWGGADPHEEPRNTVANRAMKAAFLSDGGLVTDQCGAQPCHSRGWQGAQ